MKVLIFIVLKIIEVSAVVLGIGYCPLWVGQWMHSRTAIFCLRHGAEDADCLPAWLIGFSTIFFPIAGVIGCLIALAVTWEILKKNWDRADDISYRIKRELRK